MEAPNIMHAMNEELLNLANPQEEAPPEPTAKIGSKRYLVDQIVKICEASGVPLKDSCRDMMRMKKQQLQGLVTEYMSLAQRKQMADRLGAESSCENVIAVTMVRMLHDTAMAFVEKGGDFVCRKYDYTIKGFVAKLKDEPMNEQLDNVLRELIAENADILEWTNSPGIRLALIYIQALAFTARRVKHDPTTNGTRQMGPAARAAHRRRGWQPDAVRTPQIREECTLFEPSEASGSSSCEDEA